MAGPPPREEVVMGIEERVRQILTDLDRTRENLLALSDDIWWCPSSALMGKGRKWW